MKITLERKYLQAALSAVTRALPVRTSLPILWNVLLEANGDNVRLTVTDLHTTIRTNVVAYVEVPGSVTVPASLLSDIVSRLPDAPITLELEDSRVSVRSGKSNTNMVCLPAEDYPVVAEVTDGTALTIPQSVLKEALHLTAFAASREENRSVLMGVLFDLKNDALTLVATDTHRLAWKRVGLEAIADTPMLTAVVPAKPLAELERLLRDSEDDVTVCFSDSQVQFETGTVTLTARLLDGTFPPYERLIPKAAERTATLDRAAMLEAVRRVALVSKHAMQRSVWHFQADSVTVSAHSQDIGQAREELPCSFDGAPFEIAFNVVYLLEALSAWDCQNVRLEMQSALQPAVLRPDNAPDCLYLAMPMNV